MSQPANIMPMPGTSAASAPASPVADSVPEKGGVGPSRLMEIGLHILVGGLLVVSIIGIAYVYGFNLNGNLLDNVSAAVRALGVDGGFFLGLYFSRRHWTRKKEGWGDSLRAILAGIPWFVVAIIMAGVSWLSNTLFVNGSTTIITQDALNKAGITIINAQQANWMVGGIPLLIILLYSIVPSRVEVRVDTRAPEEIEEEARREAARIRAQNMVAAARAEGMGQRLRTVAGGLVGQALNLDERASRAERQKQMRIALESAGFKTDKLSDEQVEVQAVARGVWDAAKDTAIKDERREAIRRWALARGWLTEASIAQEARLSPTAVAARYTHLEEQWREELEQAEQPLEVEEPTKAPEKEPITTPALRAVSPHLARLARQKMFTVAEASELTGRPVRTINAWIATERIKDVTKEEDEPDKKRRIPKKELIRIGWLNKDGTPTKMSNPEMAAIGNGHSNGQGSMTPEALAALQPLVVGSDSSGLAENQQS